MAGRFWPLFALVAARTQAINRPKVRATIPADGRALACAFGVLGGFDKCVQVLAERRVVSRRAARKVMHMGAGPLYLLCWPMFSASPSAKRWAAVGPLALTAKAFLAGSGLVDDPKTVASMSRSGDRRELLRGPTLYGAVFVAATLCCWRELGGVLALVALCAGDGMAEVVGASPLGAASPRVPRCRRKSLAGSAAFFLSTLGAGAAFGLGFARLGWWAPLPARALIAGVAKVAAVSALVESLDTGDWDNPLIFLAAAATAKRVFPS